MFTGNSFHNQGAVAPNKHSCVPVCGQTGRPTSMRPTSMRPTSMRSASSDKSVTSPARQPSTVTQDNISEHTAWVDT